MSITINHQTNDISGVGGSVTINGNAVPTSSLTGITNSTSPYTVALGQGAGNASITGVGNVAIGYLAGDVITSGANNILVGQNAGGSLATSSNAVGIGVNALASFNGTGSDNAPVVAIGRNAMQSSTGNNYSCVAVGDRALQAQTSGYSNTAVGGSAGFSLTTGIQNTLIGRDCGQTLTTGSSNTFLGRYAGQNVTTGGNNLILGDNAQATASNANNEITLGNASITSFRIPGLGINWTTSNIPVGIDVLKIDTISTTQAANNTTTAQIGWRTLTSQTLFGQTDGCIYTSTYNTGSMHQIFGDYRTGQVAIRGRESGTWTSWRNVLDSSNHTTYTTGPTFRAFRGTSSQTVSANSWNKVQFNTESWDTDNAFDSTPNYRFTPQKAGYYTVNVNIGSPSQAIVSIWKNGAEYLTAGCGSGGSYMSTGGLVYLNGSTDYIEGYIWTDGTSVDASATGTVFSAIWVRG